MSGPATGGPATRGGSPGRGGSGPIAEALARAGRPSGLAFVGRKGVAFGTPIRAGAPGSAIPSRARAGATRVSSFRPRARQVIAPRAGLTHWLRIEVAASVGANDKGARPRPTAAAAMVTPIGDFVNWASTQVKSPRAGRTATWGYLRGALTRT